MDQQQIASQSETSACCPKFDPEPWENKRIEWHGQLFVRERIRSFLHVPLNIRKRISRATRLIERVDASVPNMPMLGRELSAWHSDLYIPVNKVVPGVATVALSGTFRTCVFEGPFRNSARWVNAMHQYVESRGEHVHELYWGYATCPKCARQHGKNYVVLFARIDEPSGAELTPGAVM